MASFNTLLHTAIERPSVENVVNLLSHPDFKGGEVRQLTVERPDGHKYTIVSPPIRVKSWNKKKDPAA